MSNEIMTLGDRLPPSLEHEDTFYGHSDYESLVKSVKRDIFELGSNMDGWKAQACRKYAEGDSINRISKDIGKSFNTIKKAFEFDPDCRNLVHYWKCLKDLEDGPSKSARKYELWGIAMRNRESNPRDAKGAIAELNRMDEEQSALGGGKIEIVIDTSKLPRGDLDD